MAAAIALLAIAAQRDIARRRAAIDFFLKTEMDAGIIELYRKFKKSVPTLASVQSMASFTKTKKYHDIRAFLSICELIAVGVNEKAFSERVSLLYWGDVLPQTYRDAKPLIDYVRKILGEGTENTCIELEKLCTKWAKKKKRWWLFWSRG